MDNNIEQRVIDLENRLGTVEQSLMRTQILVSEALLEISKSTQRQTDHMSKTLDMIESLGIQVDDLRKWKVAISGQTRSLANGDEWAEAMERTYDQVVMLFTIEELDDILFKLGLAGPDTISGDTIQLRARSLITYSFRHGILPDLIEKLNEARPRAIWPVLNEGNYGR